MPELHLGQEKREDGISIGETEAEEQLPFHQESDSSVGTINGGARSCARELKIDAAFESTRSCAIHRGAFSIKALMVYKSS